jgi:hypothetical protein
MRLSLDFLGLAPLEVSAPLWALVWLAPLIELVPSNFVVWLYGRTGTMKSTLAALALNHYGPDFDGYHFPANFTDTPNRLEHKAFLAKDALLVIDDYAPQKSQRDAEHYRSAASHIIRSVGNRAGRGRLTSDIRARRSYAPRGLVLVTGEELPEAESVTARLFVVELKEDSLDKERLGALQAQRERLSHAMAGYLGWLSQGWAGWAASLPGRWLSYREQATRDGIHLRLPETAASLMVGLEMGLRYALSLGALPESDFERHMEQGWLVLLEASALMMQRAREERPEELFLSTFRELLAQGQITLRDAEGMHTLGGSDERAEMLGWFDQTHLYLLPGASYKRVVKHFREQGANFPASEKTLRKGLKEAGYLLERDGSSTPVVWLEGRSHRVLVLKRELVGEA